MYWKHTNSNTTVATWQDESSFGSELEIFSVSPVAKVSLLRRKLCSVKRREILLRIVCSFFFNKTLIQIIASVLSHYRDYYFNTITLIIIKNLSYDINIPYTFTLFAKIRIGLLSVTLLVRENWFDSNVGDLKHARIQRGGGAKGDRRPQEAWQVKRRCSMKIIKIFCFQVCSIPKMWTARYAVSGSLFFFSWRNFGQFCLEERVTSP